MPKPKYALTEEERRKFLINARENYCITNSLSRDEFEKVMQCTTAKDVWIALQDTYEERNQGETNICLMANTSSDDEQEDEVLDYTFLKEAFDELFNNASILFSKYQTLKKKFSKLKKEFEIEKQEKQKLFEENKMLRFENDIMIINASNISESNKYKEVEELQREVTNLTTNLVKFACRS